MKRRLQILALTVAVEAAVLAAAAVWGYRRLSVHADGPADDFEYASADLRGGRRG